MTLATTASRSKSLVTCTLCGLTTLHPLTNKVGDVFCCPSCREVAALLAESPAIEQKQAQVQGEAQSVTITLGGMWCSSCAWLVSEQLKRTKGVVDAEVSFIQHQANITYDTSISNLQSLKKRVRSLGYQATLPNEKPRDEEESFFTRLLIGGVMVLHDMVIGAGIYGRELFGLASPETQWLVDFFQIMMLATSIPVLLLLGLPILRAGFASLLRGQPNIHTLITIGTFSAFGLSVRNLIVGHGGLYFDTATMLIFLVSVGRWLEMQAHASSNKAVARLLEQIPDKATVVTEAADKTVTISELQPGMRVRVRPGERFPVDGLVAIGAGDVDESLLTGEPKPITHREGDAVKAGTINLDGSFEVITTAVGDSTTAGQIGRLLHEALWARSPLERIVDKLSAWMTPIALALATIAFLIWNTISGVETGLMVALSVLLIACPCALGLATPLTLWLSLGRAAESGAILRSTSALERLAKVDKVFFDKTGTLTQLPMKVQEVYSPSSPTLLPEGEGSQNPCPYGRGAGLRANEFLHIIASIEYQSEHPLAKAIVEYAKSQNIELRKPDSFKALPALGVIGTLSRSGRSLTSANTPALENADYAEGSLDVNGTLPRSGRSLTSANTPALENADYAEGSLDVNGTLPRSGRSLTSANTPALENADYAEGSLDVNGTLPRSGRSLTSANTPALENADYAEGSLDVNGTLPRSGRSLTSANTPALENADYVARVAIGSARLMSAEGLDMPQNISQQAEAWKEAGLVVVYAGWDGQVRGIAGLGETVRAEAKEVVGQLQSRGLRLGVLTGDDSSAGERWQKTLGIPVHAALSPDEKMKRLTENTAMIGDGINDGPALAAATVGLAMNNGTDVARTAADIVLMRDDLKVIPWLVDLSRESMKRVKQNLGWAVIYNVIGVGLAMAGLLQPIFSAFAMIASSIFVTTNAMKMNKFPSLYEEDSVVE